MANSILSRGAIAKKPVKPHKLGRTVGMPKAMGLAKAAGPKGKGAKVFAKGYKL